MKKQFKQQWIPAREDVVHIAFVHDWLYHMWWAETVFLWLIQMKSDEVRCTHTGMKSQMILNSKIFTLFSDKKFLDVYGQKFEIMTALPRWVFGIFQYFEHHRTWWLSKLFDYRNLMFFYPFLIWILRRKVEQFAPDEVIISSFAAVKNIIPIMNSRWGEKHWIFARVQDGIKMKPRIIKNTLYLHSPMQYIWDYYEDNVHKLKSPIKQLYQLITPVLRRWDKQPRYYNQVMCNSHYTAAAAQRLYGRDHCEVQYPIIDPKYLQAKIDIGQIWNYYVFIGRLVRFAKELDLIIRLFNYTEDKLIIIGSGPDEQYLRSIAWPNIEFRWQINDIDEKIKLVWRSLGLINLTRESFGMVTAEALCLWVPVFGYNQWGSVELVDEYSGVLISNKKLDYVIEQFEQFKMRKWDSKKIQDTIRWKLQQNK